MKYFWDLLFFILDKIYILYLKQNSEEVITFFFTESLPTEAELPVNLQPGRLTKKKDLLAS